jgi:hypothetical protein
MIVLKCYLYPWEQPILNDFLGFKDKLKVKRKKKKKKKGKRSTGPGHKR